MTSPALVVLNAGSSSLKFSAYAVATPAPGSANGPQRLLTGQVDAVNGAAHARAESADGRLLEERHWPADPVPGHEGALAYLLAALPHWLGERTVAAVAHRVVHGGLRYSAPVRLDAGVLADLDALVPLAPLHQPQGLAAIRHLMATAPRLAQVACFDTAFHSTQPAVAQAYALPPQITDMGVRRYGFHGLSYAHIASRLPSLRPTAGPRTIVLHLGNGASACAMRGGRSVASSMGFTALDGLVMGSRCGALDPGVVLYLIDQQGMDVRAVEHLLYQQSGLLGVSGLSADMRVLQASDDPRAQAAIGLFVYRIGREIGSLAAALGGLDSLVFTAGIGQHSASVRQAVCEAAAWLGLAIDPDAHAEAAARGEGCITRPDSRVQAWVLPADEEGWIAREACGLLWPR